MAFYAELKRRQWFCVKGFNQIREYRTYLYDVWWDSLTEDEKKEVEYQRQLRKERIDREFRTALAKIGIMSTIVAGISSDYYYDFICPEMRE